MGFNGEVERHKIVDLVVKHCQLEIPPEQGELMADFAERFFSASAVADLQERPVADLSGLLLAQWQFMYRRAPGSAKIKIFNPTFAADKWQSPHTVIEISHDDMPFLVDSIRMELDRLSYQVHFVIHLGGLWLRRDAENRVIEVLPFNESLPADASSEAPIYFEIDRIVDPNIMEELRINIDNILADVRATVGDWRNMVDSMQSCVDDLADNPPPLDVDDIKESKDFLCWLIQGNFIFLGCRDYKLIGNGVNRALQMIPNSGLGVLRDKVGSKMSRSYAELPPQARKIALAKNILIVAKTHTKSTVHHSGYTDYIGVKRFNQQGELIGERRFIGLYTSAAYSSHTKLIPFVRHKVAQVLQSFSFPHDSHDGKELVHILETLPRDDVFQASYEELKELALGILQLQERKRLRLFMRQDAYSRYFSCFVYLPKEDFTTALCSAMQTVLMESLGGIEAFSNTYFSDSVLVRIYYNIRVNPRELVEYNLAEIEQKLVVVARSWVNMLKNNLIAVCGEADGLKFFTKYHKAFPVSYQESYSAPLAVADIKKIEELVECNLRFGLSVAQSNHRGKELLRFKIFNVAQSIALSDVFPILEHMGLRVLSESSYEIKGENAEPVWINDFDILYDQKLNVSLDQVAEIFQDTFKQIWLGNIENDRLNRLVFVAQLNWDLINVLRAYTKYLRQIGFTFSQSYVEQALLNNAQITAGLMSLFKLRFTPIRNQDELQKSEKLIVQLMHDLEQVNSLDEDRILRRILELITATLRTNFFQQELGDDHNLQHKSYLSLKFNPELISDLPLPRPQFEIFVYSPRVEGVHLRGGKVARGGIRWSDRREDFRTEILGLMKAQQVKNSLILPVGAKGGFYPKLLPVTNDKDAIYNEAVACYKIFIRGLLDLTDNIVDNCVVAPQQVVKYDEDDHYLVVAADKGTATFSDIANGIAHEYNFWLGDAFASGGSAGYDHKKMGITARGAWVSVKANLCRIGIDVDKDDFTVVGIGDMAGDVFGNGMLLSKHIKLIAAFNHMHIFLDPNPDPVVSFMERQRLFDKPKSMWTDYNPQLISPGGGVYNRSAKSIPISQEVRDLLGISDDHLIPSKLIKIILQTPVDLIWNGGIGTFVKSSHESHLAALDKANDLIRVDGCQLRARTVAEGGNLGFTQLGRIEYAINYGLINTDFIDNSAGVNCSDHEVNIKILLNSIVAAGKLSIEERNSLLEQMTHDVAELVLHDNKQTTHILDLEGFIAPTNMDSLARFMLTLEKRGKLNRSLEFLPSITEIAGRKVRGIWFTRPEIAVMLSYCKLLLKEDILQSVLPEDSYFARYLMQYFPVILQERYHTEIQHHKLKREIIATQLSKNIVNRMGVDFVERLCNETGETVTAIIRAYTIASSICEIDMWWQKLEDLESAVASLVYQEVFILFRQLVRRGTRWFLRNRSKLNNVAETVDSFKALFNELRQNLPDLLTPINYSGMQAAVQRLITDHVPDTVANMIVSCNYLFTSFDIVEAVLQSKLSLADVAKTYYAVGDALNLVWLRDAMAKIVAPSKWSELLICQMLDDLDLIQRQMSIKVLLSKQNTGEPQYSLSRMDGWIMQRQDFIDKWQKLIANVKDVDNVDYAAYIVLVRELSAFVDIIA